jgi:hypothetical protein
MKSAAHDVSEGDMSHGTMGKAASRTKDMTKSAVDSLRNKVQGGTSQRDDMSTMSGNMKDNAGDKANEGAAHMGDKSDAKMNEGSGSSKSGKGQANDEVDDLIRSAKNGRM